LFSLIFGSVGQLVLLFALSFVVQQIAEFARSVLLAVNRPYVVSVHGVVENIVWGIAIVGALVAGADLYTAAALGLAAMVLSTVAGGVMVLRWGVRPSRPELDDWRRFVRLALPFAACSLVTVAALRLDTVLVSMLVPSGVAAAGAYFAATRLIASAEYLPETMGRAVYPELARRALESPSQLSDVMRPAIRDLLSVSMPVPLALVIGGSAVLPILFGPELASYSWILMVLGLAVPARFAVVLFGVSLSSSNAQGRRAVITGLALVVGQGLNVLLLPRIGVPAAVLASIVTTLMLLIPYGREIHARFGVPVRLMDVMTPLGCSCLAAVPAVGCHVLLGGGAGLLVTAVTLSIYSLIYLGSLMGLAAAQRARRHKRRPGVLAKVLDAAP
jgi:O-antigen/teichoic acid export membrane protein